MSWDAKSTRRRQSSAASTTSQNAAIHARQPSKIQAKSAHVADPYLQNFLDPNFDAVEYLNKTLPPLQGSSGSRSSSQGAVSLAELSSQGQTVLSHLNAHTTRLTNTLTQLTDDILRSGSRLAYEVELLRGETLSLAETLTEGLHDDISKFVPGGIKEGVDGKALSGEVTKDTGDQPSARDVAAVPLTPAVATTTVTPSDAQRSAAANTTGITPLDEPIYITQLRTLVLVRSRLDSVIKTFGDAMEFVFPPSELSVSSSFLSVSAPDAGGQNHSTEEKGQQVLQTHRDEISSLLISTSDPVKGIEDAARRIEELKELNKVWKGTAEEKGRTKFIDGLSKMVEDRHRDLLKEMEQASRRDTSKADADPAPKRNSSESDSTLTDNKGYGSYNLISQFQKLRGGM
jgi:hypothetical protein